MMDDSWLFPGVKSCQTENKPQVSDWILAFSLELSRAVAIMLTTFQRSFLLSLNVRKAIIQRTTAPITKKGEDTSSAGF